MNEDEVKAVIRELVEAGNAVAHRDDATDEEYDRWESAKRRAEYVLLPSYIVIPIYRPDS